METLKNIFVGFLVVARVALVVALAVIAVGAVVQGFGFLYQYTLPPEFFALGNHNDWAENGSNNIKDVRLAWGFITATGLILIVVAFWALHDVGKNVRKK